MDTLSANNIPILPSPDQATSDSQPGGQTGVAAASGISILTGGKSVVGAPTAGVDASKDGQGVVGVNSLIVDQGATETSSTSSIPGIGMDAASVLPIPPSLNNSTMVSSLTNVANDLDQVATIISGVTSNVGLLGATAGTTTSNNTTEPSTGAGGTTTQTDTIPSSGNEINMTTLEDDEGVLANQESQTLGQQITSEIDETNLQAEDTLSQAQDQIQGANQMTGMAIGGLAVSMASAGVGMSNLGAASKEADQAEMNTMAEHQESLSTASEKSMSQFKNAENNPSSKEVFADSDRATAELRAFAKSEKTPPAQQGLAENMANNLEQGTANARYLPGGPKSQDRYEGSPEQQQAIADMHAAGQEADDNPTPQQAVDFYKQRAEEGNAKLTLSSKMHSIAFRAGFKPGKTIDAAKFEDVIRAKMDGDGDDLPVNNPDAEEDNNFDEVQASIENFNPPRSSQWSNVFSSSMNNKQTSTVMLNAASQVFNTVGQSENQIKQAEGTEQQAAAQVAGTSESSMAAAVSNTISIAEQVRSTASSIAQAESSMVSSAHA
jgi:hypothetical protein